MEKDLKRFTQEQFDRAISKMPKLIMITGWNEWWAGRWQGDAAGQTVAYEYIVSKDPTKKEYNYYVDNLNPEYSRDIEPMKGGYFDNYYIQLTDYIRRYKGSAPALIQNTRKQIDVFGPFDQWNDILVT